MRHVALGWVAVAGVVTALGCRGDGAVEPPPEALKLWHTFDSRETERLNELLASRERAGEAPVEVTLLPFARAMTILADVLAAGERCPDLIRIDATWLPGLASLELVRPAPARAFEGRAWLPEAEELARHGGVAYALPQTIDGLALIHRAGAMDGAALPWPPESLAELEHAASRLRSEARYGLGLRADGYWYVPFLRGVGGSFPDPATGALGIDEGEAVEALERMGALVGDGIAAPPAAGGEQARELARLFRERRVAIVLEGPWLARELAGEEPLDSLGVTRFPRGPSGPAAPRGAQLLAVPSCAASPGEAWELAYELTEPEVQATWGKAHGSVPTTRAGLEQSGELSQAFYESLREAAPLPRHPVTAELFDDLTPAIRAVLQGDATPAEALAGVDRGWRRLFERHRIDPAPPRPERDAGTEPL